MSNTATAAMLQKKKPAKAKAKVAEVEATVPVLEVIASELQGLEKEQADAQLEELLEAEGLNDFKLGGILALYQAHSDWWGEHDKFKGFVTANLNLHYRKVMYLIKIYDRLVELDIDWNIVKSLGWTKLKEIVDIPDLDAKNVGGWVKKAEVMTVLQLIAAIKAYKLELAGGGDEEGNEPTTSDVTTMTFKVHKDQKEQIRAALDKAKEELNTEVDTVALEGLCTAYLTGVVKVVDDADTAQPTLAELMAATEDFNVVLAVFEEVFPNIDLTIGV